MESQLRRVRDHGSLFRFAGLALVFVSSAGSCSSGQQNVDAGDASNAGDSACAAGTFALVAPGSLPPSTTSSGAVTVSRSGGSCGIVAIPYSVNGTGCVSGAGQVTFADRSSTPAPIALTTTRSGTCTISLSSPSRGSLGSPMSATIQVSTAPSSAQFQFAAPASQATVAGGPTMITVTRTSASDGDWNVPYTLSGPLAAGGMITPGGGALSGSGTLEFLPNASEASLTYTPPSSAPSAVTLPANLVLTLGTPVPGPGGVPAGETALLGMQVTHTMTLQARCPPLPAGLMPTSIPFEGLNILRLPSGQIAAAPLPILMPGQGGEIQNGETSVSPGGTVELAISPCQGVVDGSLGTGCYVRTTFTNFVNLYWIGGPTASIPDAASAATLGVCWAPTANGPYYVNVRYTYDSCAYGTCGYAIQWLYASF